MTTISFLYAAGMAAGASVIWTEWADQEFEWQFALVVGIIGMVPYSVIAAAVWRANLSIFGNRVSSEPTSSAADIARAPRGTLEE